VTTCPLLALERDKISIALEGVIIDLGINITDWDLLPHIIQLSLMLANNPPPQWNLRTQRIAQWQILSLPQCASVFGALYKALYKTHQCASVALHVFGALYKTRKVKRMRKRETERQTWRRGKSKGHKGNVRERERN